MVKTRTKCFRSRCRKCCICKKSRRDDSTWNPTGRGFLHKWPKSSHNVYTFSGRPRRINMNCRTDDSTRNPTGRGFIHKWPKPRHNLYRFSSENPPDAKNVAEMIPHEIKQTAVSYINDQNPETICTDFQVIKKHQVQQKSQRWFHTKSNRPWFPT